MTSEYISAALKILSEAQAARRDRRIDPTSTIAPVPENNDEFDYKGFRPLVQDILGIVEKHQVQWNITDWPFQNFWSRPREPLHSKLLGFFIGSMENQFTHGCEVFLRRELLTVLEQQFGLTFPHDGCKVDSEKAHIDLCIRRVSSEPKYAIIFENKINDAPNQPAQLRGYVETLLKEEFKDKDIYVFYLPFYLGKKPNDEDIKWLKDNDVFYRDITFDKHILTWLNNVITKWPPTLSKGMFDNVSHYRDLIKYLNGKEKEIEMNTEILKTLKSADENKKHLTLLDVAKLKKDIGELELCIKQVIRGELFLKIQSVLLEKQGINSWFCLDEVKDKKIDIINAYDEKFAERINLCLSVNNTASVCFGAGHDRNRDYSYFWIGYMKMKNGDQSSEEAKTTERCVCSLAEKWKLAPDEESDGWYRTGQEQEQMDCDDKCVVNNSNRIVDKLVEMRNNVVDKLVEMRNDLRSF